MPGSDPVVSDIRNLVDNASILAANLVFQHGLEVHRGIEIRQNRALLTNSMNLVVTNLARACALDVSTTVQELQGRRLAVESINDSLAHFPDLATEAMADWAPETRTQLAEILTGAGVFLPGTQSTPRGPATPVWDR